MHLLSALAAYTASSMADSGQETGTEASTATLQVQSTHRFMITNEILRRSKLEICYSANPVQLLQAMQAAAAPLAMLSSYYQIPALMSADVSADTNVDCKWIGPVCLCQRQLLLTESTHGTAVNRSALLLAAAA